MNTTRCGSNDLASAKRIVSILAVVLMLMIAVGAEDSAYDPEKQALGMRSHEKCSQLLLVIFRWIRVSFCHPE